ncbi:MAG: hypothetical protein ACO3A2_10465 [Bdellovibrionia bacterium]
MSKSIFHDARVVGAEYKEQYKLLDLKVRLSNKEMKEISFQNVFDFGLEGFCNQNILFDIVQYGQNKEPIDEVQMMFPGLTQSLIEFAKNKGYSIYILEPSSGLTGYIVATDFTVTNQSS